MNNVVLCGRLTRDPEIRYSTGENQTCIARYVLAVDRRQRREEGKQAADFIQCVSLGKAAEFAQKYFAQGLKIMVRGRIVTGAYTDKEGRRVYTTEVMVEDQEFSESKKDGSPAAAEATEPAADGSDFMSIPDGMDVTGLPFN